VTVYIPPLRHSCQQPRYRPRSEWQTVAPPLAFMRPRDRLNAKSMPIPTGYPPGTVWVCGCGRGWIACQDRYGLGDWVPVRWWNFRIRKRIDAHERQAALVAATEIVSSFVLPEAL
jgi:hypothetical protein